MERESGPTIDLAGSDGKRVRVILPAIAKRVVEERTTEALVSSVTPPPILPPVPVGGAHGGH